MNNQNTHVQMSVSEVFEGPNSSLRKAYDAAVIDDFDLPEPAPGPAATAPRVHISGGSVCVGCEG